MSDTQMTSLPTPLNAAASRMTRTEPSWNEAAALLVGQDLVVVPPMFLDGDAATDPSQLPEDERRLRQSTALALIQHWASLSFVLSKADAVRMCALPPPACRWLHSVVTPALRARLGGHVTHKPMYANFPKSVMEADAAELLYNALAHYTGDWVDVRVLPIIPVNPRAATPIKDRKTRPLTLVLGDELRPHLARWTQSATAWTPALSSLMTLLFPLLQHYGLIGAAPGGPAPKWPNRENQAQMAAQWLRETAGASLSEEGASAARRLASERSPDLTIPSPTSLALVAPAWPFGDPTATDLLRTVMVLSGGTADLARDGRPSTHPKSTRVKVAKLSRPQRRALMAALEQAAAGKTALEDLHTYRPQWRTLAERLHAGEWTDRFPRAAALIDQLRNAPAPVTWGGRLDALLAAAPSGAAVKALHALALERPGAIVRAAHRLLAWAGQPTPKGVARTATPGRRPAWSNDLRALIREAAEHTEAGVVLAAWGTLRRAQPGPRLMIPKGRVDKRYRVPAPAADAGGPLRPLVATDLRAVLVERFGALAPLGAVHVAPGLDGILLPQGLRDSSDTGAGVVARGSRVPMDIDPTGRDQIVRLFLWWHDTDTGRVDIDLSAVGVSDTFKTTEVCSFRQMRATGLVHSGDLTSAPNGASEFVDVDLNGLSPKTRYVVMTANVYSGPTFDQIPDCFVGWMERTKAQAGPIHDIRTVHNKIAVTARTKAFLGAVFDRVTRTITWLDTPLDIGSSYSFHDNASAVARIVEDFELYAASRVSVGELVDLHIEARGGTRVADPAAAATRFTVGPVVPAAGQTVMAATRPEQVMALLPSLRGVDSVREPTAPADATAASSSTPSVRLSAPTAADTLQPAVVGTVSGPTPVSVAVSKKRPPR